MNVLVKHTPVLHGKAFIPGSKSQSIRAMLFALLAKGESTLVNALDSADTQVARRVFSALGAEIKLDVIHGHGVPLQAQTTEIHTGNSGITTLFTLPLLGLRADCAKPIILDCGFQMKARPVKPLVNALGSLGMHIDYLASKGQLPIVVTGQLKGGRVEIDGLNSQYVSALLMSLPCAQQDSVMTVSDLHERPYVDMTLVFLKQLGIQYTHERAEHSDKFTIPGNQHYPVFHHVIQGDFSSASCVIAAAVLLPGEVELCGLDYESSQGDKALISLLKKMGAEISIEKNSIKIQGGRPLTGMQIDANAIPDLLPALAVIGTQAIGKTEIINVPQARIKETDRIHAMTEGLRRMGAHIDEQPDGMTLYQSKLHGAFVKGYDDHRTVMALSVAGLISDKTTCITDGEAIHKTYPQFVETLIALGANIAAHQHIILIGFKHVGKTVIGQGLAATINKPFIDLDRAVETAYEKQYGTSLTCRQMMQTLGEGFYRVFESRTLESIILSPSSVIALGGGTLCNQLIQSHFLLHVEAPMGSVFERIMLGGRPAFFDPNQALYEAFTQLWNERHEVFKSLTTRVVYNNKTVQEAVEHAMTYLSDEDGYELYHT